MFHAEKMATFWGQGKILKIIPSIRIILRNNVQLFSNSSATELKISESCLRRLKEMKKDGSFLRVSVDGGGCSGFQYKFSLDKEKQQDDIVVNENGVNVIVDETSLDLLKGSTLDYEEELIRSGFRIINNPLAEQGCSCGASFSLKIS